MFSVVFRFFLALPSLLSSPLFFRLFRLLLSSALHLHLFSPSLRHCSSCLSVSSAVRFRRLLLYRSSWTTGCLLVFTCYYSYFYQCITGSPRDSFNCASNHLSHDPTGCVRGLSLLSLSVRRNKSEHHTSVSTLLRRVPVLTACIECAVAGSYLPLGLATHSGTLLQGVRTGVGFGLVFDRFVGVGLYVKALCH